MGIAPENFIPSPKKATRKNSAVKRSTYDTNAYSTNQPIKSTPVKKSRNGPLKTPFKTPSKLEYADYDKMYASVPRPKTLSLAE